MKKKHIQVYDRSMNRVAILNRAYKIGYELEQNNIWTCQFTLPLNDPKRNHITPKRFIELWDHDKRIGMFIVQPIKTKKNTSDRSITYTCEHVLGTLHSEVLFRYHQFTNWTTRQVLQALIDMQEEVFWKLGTVDFTRYFHYGWENEESLLNAIVSVPKTFDQSYLWDWDDTTFPFTLNLISPTDEYVDTLRFGKNLKGIEKDEDPYGIVNRIYPLGYGEGVNQLGIEKVNGGIPYLQDQASIDEYGLQKQIWPDRRFEDAESLKASAQALLNRYKDPITTVSVDCINYELIDPYKIVKYGISKILRVEDKDTETNIDLRIVKIVRSDIYGAPQDIKFDLGNVREPLETTITDLEKKQLVNETYSQGSTNIDTHDYSDNSDQNNPAVIRFYLPDDLVNVNAMTLTYETEEFRAYSKATKGGGAIVESTSGGGAVVKSTSSGGGSTQTSSSGGGSSQTSSSGGGSTQTSSSGGGSTESSSSGGGWNGTTNLQEEVTAGIAETAWPKTQSTYGMDSHTHSIYPHQHSVAVPNHSHSVNIPSHTHSTNIPSHTHSVEIPNHTHNLTIPHHTHDIDIPDHSHSITLPNHTHDIEHGIFKLTETPSAVVIKVDGNTVPVTSTNGSDIDLIPYLSKDSGGRINRGQWHEVTITPNQLGRVNANIISRLFIQSRIGGTF
ncbi:phage tail spike protein [Metabacillus sp. FJAT-53654]|uniref:Phage tail spike protein n=1 Tax=Metabacillus rhizosphaerae TaxID=3117747 RepID=A0ABZ2MZ93_9BACI